MGNNACTKKIGAIQLGRGKPLNWGEGEQCLLLPRRRIATGLLALFVISSWLKMYKNILQGVSLKDVIYLEYVTVHEILSFLHSYSPGHLRLLSSQCMFHLLFHKYVNYSLRNIIPSVITNLRSNCYKLIVHRSRLNLRKSFLTNRCFSSRTVYQM